MKGIRVIKTDKQIKFEGVWGELEANDLDTFPIFSNFLSRFLSRSATHEATRTYRVYK